MLKLRLDKFKKVGQDETSSTLVSPKGEKIKIAHSLLPASMKDQIAKMPMSLADGGETNNSDTVGAPNDSSNRNNNGRAPVIVNVEQAPASQPQQSQPLDDQGQHFITNADKIKQGIMGIPSQMPGLWNPQAAQDYASNVVAENTPPPMQSTQPDTGGDASYGQMQSSPMQSTPPESAPNQSTPPQLGGDLPENYKYGDDYLKGLKEQQRAGEFEAQAIRDKGSAQEQSAHDLGEGQDFYHKFYMAKEDFKQGQINEVEKNLADEKTGHINPNNYLENMGTGQKIATVIGLILGGMGSGLTHEENPALKFLNAQIERDVQSQQNNINNKQTLLGAYMKQMGNIQDAEKMTYVFLNEKYASQLDEQAAKASDPIAKARATQAAAIFHQKAGEWNDSLALQRAKMAATQSLQGGQANTGFNLERLDPEMRKRVVPLPTGGYGLAYDEKEADAVKNSFTNLKNLKSMIQDMRDFQTKIGRTFPNSDQDKIAENKREAMILVLNQLHDLKRLNDNEFITNKNLIPDIGALRQDRAKAQLDNLENLINMKFKAEYENHLEGFNGKAPSSFGGAQGINKSPPKIKGR